MRSKLEDKSQRFIIEITINLSSNNSFAMFESDDYDQILSQIEFPESSSTLNLESSIVSHSDIQGQKKGYGNDHNITEQLISSSSKQVLQIQDPIKAIAKENIPTQYSNIKSKEVSIINTLNNLSPKHSKRKILNSHFDHKNKRKFPGPAGLLTGSLVESKDDVECQLELFSQDIDFTQNHLTYDIWESPLWKRLLEDTKSLKVINSIKAIKLQAVAGNLQKKKAQIVIAFIESVDRSAIDPLITLRDKTDKIKCTLHRDAWTAFSSYLASEYCAVVLWKPTVLTTGSAFKKHYLNITLSNISSIYSSAIINEDELLPEGCEKNIEEHYTVIKMGVQKPEVNLSTLNEGALDNSDLLDDLDNIFSDDIF